jgi:hypothetical protein
MSDTRLNVTPGWGPGHRHWCFDPNMTPKMQAREHGPVGCRRRRHRFDSTGPTPTHVLVKRDDRRRLREALDEASS